MGNTMESNFSEWWLNLSEEKKKKFIIDFTTEVLIFGTGTVVQTEDGFEIKSH